MNDFIKSAYKNSELTGKIIGSAMRVHAKMGAGFQEVIYQRCLALEMSKADLTFARECEMQIYYDGIDVGTRRVDFLVEGIVMVELKAIAQIEDVHVTQALNYLEAYQLEIGLLINFGAKSLQVKRVTNEYKIAKG